MYSIPSHELIPECLFLLTFLWWVETRLQTVEELIKAQLPVGVLVGELYEGVDTQTPEETAE